MAATTIGRATWTDGSSGTVINNARLQADVYDKIDAMIAAAITFGSTISAEGFGTYSFSAGGTGNNTLSIRNTTAGTTNASVIRAGNDTTINVGEFIATSTTYTTVGELIANALGIRGNTAGGISINANHASGAIRFGINASDRLKLTNAGTLISAPGGSFPTDPGVNLVLAGTTPLAAWYESDQGADGKWWTMSAAAGVLLIQVLNDALSSSTTAMSITRSGTTISAIAFGGPVSATSFSTNDLFFANGFALTEHFKVGIDTPGMALLTPEGDVVLFVDERGRLHANELTADLAELGWVRTTKEERYAMDTKAA